MDKKQPSRDYLDRPIRFIKRYWSRGLTVDIAILLTLNIIYWSRCLFSEGTIVGFLYRQDAYEYVLKTNYVLKLLEGGIAPFGIVWFDPIYCGFAQTLFPGPTLFLSAQNFLVSYNLTLFFYYFLSSLTMYYLASTFHLDRFACLVSSIAYTFSQFLMYEALLGHLSMVFAMAFIPLIVAISVSNSRSGTWKKQILLCVLLSVLLLERPDFAYFTIVFLLIFIPLTTKPPRLKSLLPLLIPLAAAFLITFPFLGSGFLSQTDRLAEAWGVYNYAYYSPYPFQLFVPLLMNVEAYLGLSVLFLSTIGGLTAMIPYLRRKGADTKNEKSFVLLFFLAILFIFIGLGANTPLYGFLYEYAPYFSGLRAPARWLIMAQLCLALLAGRGTTILAERFSAKTKITWLSKRQAKTAFIVLAVVVIFLDLSTFIVCSDVPEWRATVKLGGDAGVFILPQPSKVDQKSDVYEFIRADSGQYRILITPTVYSTSYWDYLRYLQDTNVTLAGGYGFNPSLSEFQEEVYYELRKGNITTQIGEELALLGVKYVVYDYRRGRLDTLVKKMNYSDDLEFLLDDGSYILYLNKRFGDIPPRINLLNDPSFEEVGGWRSWVRENGSAEDSTVFLSGNVSMKCSVGDFQDLAGGIQYYFPNASEREFTLSGWCKADVTGDDVLYFIRATRVYDDGVSGAYAFFNQGTHDWEYSSVTFSIDPTRELKRLEISFSIRNGNGTVWFDDLYLSPNTLADGWKGFYAVRNLYADVDTLFSERNLVRVEGSFWRENPMELRVKANITEPCFIILSESFDDGWKIQGENIQENVSILDYKGLLTLSVKRPSYLDLTLKFTTYIESLNRIIYFFALALIVLILPQISRLVCRIIHHEKMILRASEA